MTCIRCAEVAAPRTGNKVERAQSLTQDEEELKALARGEKMLIDTDTVNAWYVLSKGFKVYSQCPNCHSQHISYHKVREPGYAGVMPVCQNCSKVMPTRMKPTKVMERKISAVI